MTGSIIRYYMVLHGNGGTVVRAHTKLDAVKRAGIPKEEIQGVIYHPKEEKCKSE